MTNPTTFHRRSIRLAGYDYSRAGAYFVTICAEDRVCLFGDVMDGAMKTNPAGDMVARTWDEMPAYYAGVDVDAYVIMPNHTHAIVVLASSLDSKSTVGAGPRARPDVDDVSMTGRPQGTGQPQGVAPTDEDESTKRLSLPDLVHRFKSRTTNRYSQGVEHNPWPRFPGRLWQRN
jgi:putative transposase